MANNRENTVTLPNNGGVSNEIMRSLEALLGTKGELDALQLARLRKDYEKEQEAERVKRASIEVNKKSLEQERRNRKLEQDNCPHMLPNGRTALSGQKDSSYQTILICMHCQKLYGPEDSVPGHLRPDPLMIGGMISG